MTIEFEVMGEPRGKGRPRATRVGRMYTPAETANYENLVRTVYAMKFKGMAAEANEPIAMTIKAFYTIPTSASKRKQEEMENGVLRPTKKPDADNVIKIIADALNKVAYPDDTQIVSIRCEKWYSRQPRVEVILETIHK